MKPTKARQQHTEGKWIVKKDEHNLYDTELVSDVTGLVHVSISGCTDEALNLIAAAPMLLEALKLCVDKLALWPEGSNPEFFPGMKLGRKAIAAAEGGQNNGVRSNRK